MAFAPALAIGLSAAGAVASASSQYSAAKTNQAIASNEQKLSVDQANAQEGQVRRNSREMLGRQSAAFGAAGVGYGGSSEFALDDSAINQEYDALSTRYKGTVTGYGYGVEAQQDQHSAGLLAGSALLQGAGSTYAMYSALYPKDKNQPP